MFHLNMQSETHTPQLEVEVYALQGAYLPRGVSISGQIIGKSFLAGIIEKSKAVTFKKKTEAFRG